MIRFHLCDYGEFDAERKVGPTCWPHFDLLWVHDGRLRVEIGRQKVEFGSGEGLLIYPDTAFVGETLVPVSRASVQHFEIIDDKTSTVSKSSRRLLEPYRRLFGRRQGFELYQALNPTVIDRDIDRAITWGEQRQTRMIHSLRVAQMAVILGELHEMSRVSPTASAYGRGRFSKLLTWLQAHQHESIDLEMMAQQAGLSVSHFRALFRQHFGMAPGAYLTHLRTQEAARQLRQTTMPIKQVARRVGYTELAGFYRAFKKAIGESPACYRRHHSPLA